MTNVTMRERIGASRGKLALVGLLAVVLIVVIVIQLPSSTNIVKAPTVPASTMPEREAADSDGVESANAPEKNLADQPPRTWPELSTNAIVAFDPLRAPPWYLAATHVEQSNENEQDDPTLALAEEKARSSALEALQQAGTTIVLIANGERIATIGDQRIRIGDRIEGYLVSDITDQGVVLTKPRSR